MGDASHEISELAERTNGNIRGSFVDHGEITVDHKVLLMSKSAIYLQPSYFEGFGLAAAEAMSFGACVVTCDVGAVREVCGDAAIYVAPGDIAGFVDALAGLICSPDVLIERQLSSLQRVVQLGFIEDKVKRLGALIDS